MEKNRRIFLAHAREDEARVRSLYHCLKDRGFDPWLDKLDLIPGQLWKDEIPKVIASSGVFLACLSKQSVRKQSYLQREFRLALSAYADRPPGSIFLIPVRLDDCEVPDLRIPDFELGLTDIHWVDLFEEDGFDKLVSAIEIAFFEAEPMPEDKMSPSSENVETKAVAEPTVPAESLGLTMEDTRPINQRTTNSSRSHTDRDVVQTPASPKRASRNPIIIAAVIGAIATIAAAFLGSPFLGRMIGPGKQSSVEREDSDETITIDPSVGREQTQPPSIATPEARSMFKDCDRCPELVVVPSGRFLMGSEFGHPTEKPQIEKVISSPYALGRFEVTVSEWLMCQHAGACQQVAIESSRLPVGNISWQDANLYVSWLAALTGKPYRLPSETEWEYAARAGTSTKYSTGGVILTRQANFSSDSSEPNDVGQYEPNAFGLFDMLGNVWEWVADCKNDYTSHGTIAGAIETEDCDLRVLRGGGWRSTREDLRSANRYFRDGSHFQIDFGFRVARDLTEQELAAHISN